MLTLHSLPEDAAAGKLTQADSRYSIAESPRPSRALVEPVRTVEEALRIAEGSAGSQAAAGLADLAGRRRIRNLVHQHLGLAMI